MQEPSARPLDESERSGLQEYRDWVANLLLDAGSDIALDGTEADLPTLQSLLDAGPYTEEPLAEVLAFSTAFGDVLAKALGMQWVVYEDEHGSDFALQHEAKAVYLFPQDSILKKIEDDGSVHVSQLYRDLVEAATAELEKDNLQTHS